MRNRIAKGKSWLIRWARGIGKLTAQTEMTLVEAKEGFETKVRDSRAWRVRVLKKLAVQHRASHRALKEFRVGLGRASAELIGACQSAVTQFRA